jgi:hypothetical protein
MDGQVGGSANDRPEQAAKPGGHRGGRDARCRAAAQGVEPRLDTGRGVGLAAVPWLGCSPERCRLHRGGHRCPRGRGQRPWITVPFGRAVDHGVALASRLRVQASIGRRTGGPRFTQRGV